MLLRLLSNCQRISLIKRLLHSEFHLIHFWDILLPTGDDDDTIIMKTIIMMIMTIIAEIYFFLMLGIQVSGLEVWFR